jgi:hypothetical protein
MDKKRWGRWVLVALTFLSFGLTTKNTAFATAAPPRDGRTPPRLSLLDGEVSFWRPGNDDWAAARLNAALAPGDALYTGPGGRLEVQFGAQSFLRADTATQLALDSQEPDYVVFKLTSGRTAFDIRRMSPGETVEVDTPQAAFTIEQPGYYRVEVSGATTRFLTRRGGHARITPAAGEATQLGPSQEVVIDGDNANALAVSAASELDDWDQWNYGRTDALLTATSAQYVPEGVYGAADLDHYGDWRTVPEYGRVWAPAVAPGWVPYSTGSWVYDSYYGWTWVDAAPWGWAPFHYGRWVYASSYWAWAPGPIVVAPYYAPALVTFFGGAGFHVGIAIGVPAVSWVALGWGEPCLPWWGRSGFIGRPWWGGWGGPHIVDHRVIQTTNINITNVNVFEHVRNHQGVVAVPRDGFGKSPVDRVRLARVENEHLAPANQLLPRRPQNPNRLPQRETGDPRDAVLTKQVVNAGPMPGRERSAVPHTLPDQSRSSGVTSVNPRGRQGSAAETIHPNVRDNSPAMPPRFEDQSRGPRHPVDRGATLPPPSDSARPNAVGGGRVQPLHNAPRNPEAVRLTPPPLPDALNRGSQRPDDFGRSGSVPQRFEGQTRERRAPNAPQPGARSNAAPPPPPAADRQPQNPSGSVNERRLPPPQHLDTGPRTAVQPPAPSRPQPSYNAPRSFSNEDLEPRRPAAQAPPAPAMRPAPMPAPQMQAPAMRQAPAPAPRVDAPHIAPRSSFDNRPAMPMPQHFERPAPAPAPMPNVAPNAGGGSGDAPSRERRHPHEH